MEDKRSARLDEYGFSRIHSKVDQLVGRHGFTESDREDLVQHLVYDLLRRLSRYDPEKAQFNTFIERVIEHEIADILAARTAAMRDYRKHEFSLNEMIASREYQKPTEKIEIFDHEKYLLQTGQISRPMAELQDLRADLKRVLSLLPEELRDLCIRLQTQTITEISRETGVPRTTLYGHIRKLRAIFKEAGLDEYL